MTDTNVLKNISAFITSLWNKESKLKIIKKLHCFEKTITFAVSLDQIKTKKINCSVTSMNFFDRLKDDGVVRSGGSICKCFDETFEGILIQDELRKVVC